MPKSVLPGSQPSATAFSQLLLPSRWPTMTFRPLSLRLSDLPRTLHAVADDGDGFVFQDFAGFLQGELLARNNIFFDSAEIDLCHN